MENIFAHLEETHILGPSSASEGTEEVNEVWTLQMLELQ